MTHVYSVAFPAGNRYIVYDSRAILQLCHDLLRPTRKSEPHLLVLRVGCAAIRR